MEGQYKAQSTRDHAVSRDHVAEDELLAAVRDHGVDPRCASNSRDKRRHLHVDRPVVVETIDLNSLNQEEEEDEPSLEGFASPDGLESAAAPFLYDSLR